MQGAEELIGGSRERLGSHKICTWFRQDPSWKSGVGGRSPASGRSPLRLMLRSGTVCQAGKDYGRRKHVKWHMIALVHRRVCYTLEGLLEAQGFCSRLKGFARGSGCLLGARSRVVAVDRQGLWWRCLAPRRRPSGQLHVVCAPRWHIPTPDCSLPACKDGRNGRGYCADDG